MTLELPASACTETLTAPWDAVHSRLRRAARHRKGCPIMDQVERSRLAVSLFGTPTVRQLAVPIHLSPQQLALVALVYGHGRTGLTRVKAARLLWQSDVDAAARHRLRQLLVEIRSRARGNLVGRHGDVLMAMPRVYCDLLGFDRCVGSGMLSDAAHMLTDGFARLSLGPDATGYDDWRSGRELAFVRRLRAQAFVQFEQATRSGRLDSAWDAAEALYTIDTQEPKAVLRVIEARGRTGRLPAAETAFAAYLETLSSAEEPDPEIVEAFQRARETVKLGSSSIDGADEDIPLVGRREAILAVRNVFKLVEGGRFGFALITGEPGIGKTRLLRELHREAVFHGFRCLEAQAIELESRLPLTPLLDALGSVDLGPYLAALGRPWDAVIGAVLPAATLVDEAPEELPPIQESALTRRLLDAFRMLLGRLAQEEPTLFFFDDLQWADPTTIAVLQFVQRRWSGGPLGVVAAIREDLVTRNAPVNGYLSPHQAISIHRIPLGDLSVPDARKLVDVISAGRISADAKRRICELAGSHPLFLTELTRDYIAGQLRLPKLPADEVTIPVSLKQVLDGRLERIGTKAIKLAGMLAVAGRSLSLSDASQLTELTLDETADAVDELIRARLVRVDNGRLSISHELFRSAIYRHIGEPRRAINHRIAANHILRGSEGTVGELAIHYARAGEADLAAKHGWAAARRARETGAVSEAAHFFQLVMESEADAVRRADATAELAHALHLARDIDRASPLLEVAAARLREVGNPAGALRAEIKRIEGLVELGETPIRDLWPMLDPIKREARNNEDWEALALALDTELHLLHRDGDVEGIRKLFVQMREVSRRGSPEASLLAHAGLALGVLFDDPEEALQAALQAVTMTSDAGPYQLTAMLRLLLVLHYRGMLSLPDFASTVDATRRLAASSGDVLLRFSIENNLAVAELDAGNLERAETMMNLCAELSHAADMDLNRAIQANNRAELALARGDYQTAARDYSEASTFFGVTTPAYMKDLVNAGLGYCALEEGNLSEARRKEQELHEPPRSWYFDPTTILAFRARLLERRGRHEDAVALLDSNATNLEGRLVLAWLKLRSLQVRLMIRRHTDVADARKIAAQAGSVANELRLELRSLEFLELADRPASQRPLA